MLRYNTSFDTLEQFTQNNGWEEVGTPAFTVIADNQFNGDGSTIAFTLSQESTTAGSVVAINGVQQLPTTAYAIVGTTLTFTEAPAAGDVIDVRMFTTTTSVTEIRNAAGNAIIDTSESSANILVTGNLVVSGPGVFVGDGSGLTNLNVSGNTISSGTSKVDVVSVNGNVATVVAGSTILTVSPGLVDIQGNLTVSGNATLTGNILGDRIQNGTTSFDIQSASGNANITIGGTSNVAVFTTAGVNVTGTVSADGTVTGGNLVTSGAISSTGTATVGNVVTGGTISSTGNILTGSQFNGSGAGLTSIPGANVTGTVASATNATTAGTVTTATQGNITSVGTLTALAVTGNISSGNVSGTNITGTLTTASQTNITSVGTLTSLAVSGAITTGGGIVNSQGTGVGNIGSSSVFFDTVFAKATSAQYADLAEKYEADAEYAPGTVLEFGGDKEVTLSTEAGSTRVAGVVSTNPSYIMNAGLTAEHVAMVALQGRVPCRVIGPVAKGDMMVATGNGAAQVDNSARAGSIIGKALENFDGAEGTIEVVIGRN